MKFAAWIVLLLPSLAAAQPRDVAELFPPDTVAYAELRDPAAVADAVAGTVKGSPFERGLRLLHDRRDTAKDPRFVGGSSTLAGAVLATSPEFLAEFRKLQGAAIGFFGLTANGEPKIAGCVATGGSVAAALYARAFLANESSFRRVASVDGVPLLQSRARPAQAYDPNSGKPVPYEPKPATEGPCEPTFAIVDGLFVVGSNKEAVAELLARFKGRPKDSLATSPGFPAKRPAGLFAFVRTVELVRLADAARKANKELLSADWIGQVRFLGNPRSIPRVMAYGALDATGVRWTLEAVRDPRQASPLLDLVAGVVPADAPSLFPPGSAGGFSFGLPAKDRRASALLAFADAVVQSRGHVGRSATEWLGELEARSKLPLREKVLPDVRGLSVILFPKAELPPRVEPFPLVALHLEPTAAEWETAIPKVFSALDGSKETAQPSSETIRGVKVWTATVDGMPWHFARRASTWIFGLDRKQVADCGAANGPTTISNDLAVGSLSWPGLTGYETLRTIADRFEQRSRGQNSLDLPIGSFLPPGLLDSPAVGLAAKEFRALYGSLPPLALRANRAGDRFAIEARWDFGRDGAKAVLEKLVPILERIGTAPPNDGLGLPPFDR